MTSITSQFSWVLSSSSSVLVANDKSNNVRHANFSQIPSWFSLKSSPSSLRTNPNKQGEVENLHLISLTKQGKLREVHEFIERMDKEGISINPQSYEYLFKMCGTLRALSDGRLFHNRLQGFSNSNRFIDNCILHMYCDCKSFTAAERFFEKMVDRDLFSWATIISAYTKEGHTDEAVRLLLHMLDLGIKPNSSIFSTLIMSFADPSLLDLGKQIHSQLIRIGFAADISVETLISNMYVKCGWLDGAEVSINKMTRKNVVACTGLMVGYTQATRHSDAMLLFAKMIGEGVELDEFAFSIVLKACATLGDLYTGRQIHSVCIKLGLESEVSVGTPLVDFYVKCARFDAARRAFETICEPNDFSWSALIVGYCQSGRFDTALEVFKTIRSKGVLLNSFIYTNIFQACSAVSDLMCCAQIHADAIKKGLVSFLSGESAMITMYSKCGKVDYAHQAFLTIDKPDTIAWTAIISAHAYHGKASEALGLFKEMQRSGVKPNAVTFIGLLNACSHSGLVKEGKQFLDSMSDEYGVNPTIDHYNCMIDIYSRAGMLQEAHEMIRSLPLEPDVMSWKSLLGGCWSHRNLEIGMIAADNIFRLDPLDSATYVIMFNLYSLAGKWDEAAKFRKMMAERNLRKEVSCSWINVKGKVHRFVVGDRHHPQTEQIYSKLKELNFSLKKDGEYLLNEEDALSDFTERKEQLLVHSERLAIAYGLMCTAAETPIMVFKNTRSCKDCHDFAKRVSMVTGRELIVRDATRFHHINSGDCSCCDYW
ncbi:pentatricopeptide repeat-containing protein At5g13270, chloroplastic isoform X1 [Vigna unguiculata]|uniref:pentatricopeptide repeat-containing protein At5g13270, chloroplastic isoform X1 n=2 Tax=Vigna unguiculata TaxID=3917 RepID=UPI001015CD4D|nr:pentatricopeptide repeat-containing protein At5g13270, chloroplastic isoform X1 [Vigna unguiculata]XP_027903260.1 pentatricopeptide repeat-containing protein At5g13270, chloroplastic isoform X1 [Vigna unguiculata]XP_027903261.1 pentatricopeptide repeat-containing protein At5g13270, chloroplastic isoform X1 [Vigna unguiculata]XP_027903262.1 pentatricopeptide repeat-containing protein At5g13270, chloroplastic isoform X1 [Vigna unguiculata]XP_027903263.1 pentatricopeptide repeat-containing prot